MFRFSLFAIILSTATAWPVQAEEPLEAEILKITEGADARIGVALIVDGQDTLTVNNDYGYPLMSVMKLHQAIAITSYLEEKGRSLDETISITNRDLKPDTWSPLRDRYPEGNVRMSIRELLCYTLQQSDNNACDILFSRILGTDGVDSLLRTAGVKDFAIAATEDAMHRELSRCQDNWSTPLSTAEMLDRLVAGRLPLDENGFIIETLLDCRTGANRLPLPLQGTEARIGHKTGTSDLGKDGRWTGINDAGFVLLPDGRRYTLVVFISGSAMSMEATEKIIADISAVVYTRLSEHDNLTAEE